MDDSGNNEDPRWSRQPTENVRAPLNAEALATAHNATALRHQFRDWLATRDIPVSVVDDLVLAVSEAIANAAEHAYPDHTDGPGLMRLEAHHATGYILVIISDRGSWRTPIATGVRGRGIPLMRLLTQNIHIRADHRGTVIHLRVELPPPPDPSLAAYDQSQLRPLIPIPAATPMPDGPTAGGGVRSGEVDHAGVRANGIRPVGTDDARRPQHPHEDCPSSC